MIHLSLLGNLELVADDGRAIQSVLAQPKRLALLVYLAAASPRGFHSRDRLLTLFWPDMDEASARNSLRQSLHHLRRSLGEDAIRSRGEEVGIDPERLACDVAAFEAALEAGEFERAMALYRGDLLGSFFLEGAPEFEGWLAQEHTRLRRRAAETAWRLSEQAEGRSQGTEAVRWARQAYAFVPEEEAGMRRLVALLGRQGERAEAVREYEAFAQRLRTEYELEPSPEARALLREIRSRDPRAAGENLPKAPEVTPAGAADPSEPHHSENSGIHDGTAERVGVPPAPAAVDGGATTASAPVSERRTSKRGRAWGWAAVIALVVGGSFLAFTRERSNPLEEGRVLVAAFENRTGDPALDALGEMAADWITQGLQQSGLVEVIDPASSLLIAREVVGDSAGLEGSSRMAKLAAASGARTMVSGAFYLEGDSVVYRAQITDVETGKVLHAMEPLKGSRAAPARGVEALRSRVAGALASMLDRRIASLSAPASRPPNFEAYREYAAGLELFVDRRYAESLPHFEAAARLDSMFSLPLVWAVHAHGNNGDLEQRDSVIRLLATRRSRLAPLELHALDYFQARMFRGDIPAALESARKAARLSPGSQWSHTAGGMAMALNRPEEALEHLKRIDPERGWAKGWTGYWRNLTDAHHLSGQYEAELQAAERVRRLTPDLLLHRYWEIRALVALGRIEKAMERLDEALLLSPHDNFTAGQLAFEIGLELRAHGHLEEAANQFQFAIDWFRSPALEEWVRGQNRPERARQQMQARFGRVLYEAGFYKEAHAHVAALAPDDPGQHNAVLGLIAARQGNRSEAERMIGLLEDSKSDLSASAQAAMNQARIAALLGDRVRTIAYLRESARSGRDIWGFVDLHLRTEFDALRDDPAFQAIARPKG